MTKLGDYDEDNVWAYYISCGHQCPREAFYLFQGQHLPAADAISLTFNLNAFAFLQKYKRWKIQITNINMVLSFIKLSTIMGCCMAEWKSWYILNTAGHCEVQSSLWGQTRTSWDVGSLRPMTIFVLGWIILRWDELPWVKIKKLGAWSVVVHHNAKSSYQS